MLQAQLPPDPAWKRVSTLGYTIGFIEVITKRQRPLSPGTR